MSSTHRPRSTQVIAAPGAPYLQLLAADGSMRSSRWLAKELARAAHVGNVIWLQGEGPWHKLVKAIARGVFGRGEGQLPVRVVPSIHESSHVAQWDLLPGDVLLAFGPPPDGEASDYAERRVTLASIVPIGGLERLRQQSGPERAKTLLHASVELTGSVDRMARAVVRALRQRGTAA